jgi:hypothetical protein
LGRDASLTGTADRSLTLGHGLFLTGLLRDFTFGRDALG